MKNKLLLLGFCILLFQGCDIGSEGTCSNQTTFQNLEVYIVEKEGIKYISSDEKQNSLLKLCNDFSFDQKVGYDNIYSIDCVVNDDCKSVCIDISKAKSPFCEVKLDTIKNNNTNTIIKTWSVAYLLENQTKTHPSCSKKLSFSISEKLGLENEKLAFLTFDVNKQIDFSYYAENKLIVKNIYTINYENIIIPVYAQLFKNKVIGFFNSNDTIEYKVDYNFLKFTNKLTKNELILKLVEK